jgi:hypothetical protein
MLLLAVTICTYYWISLETTAVFIPVIYPAYTPTHISKHGDLDAEFLYFQYWGLNTGL